MRIALLAVAVAALVFSGSPSFAEDEGIYTPDFTGNPAPLNWDPDNSPVHPDLSYRILDELRSEYDIASRDMGKRFAGHYMVWQTGCGGYVQCGVILDLETGQPVTQLPTAGSGGYEFFSHCDLLSVRTAGPNKPGEEAEHVLYRLTDSGLVRLESKYDECSYGSID